MTEEKRKVKRRIQSLKMKKRMKKKGLKMKGRTNEK